MARDHNCGPFYFAMKHHTHFACEIFSRVISRSAEKILRNTGKLFLYMNRFSLYEIPSAVPLGEIKLMINEALQINSFIFGLKAESREQVLQNIAWQVGRKTEADMTWLADQLLQSETREPSGIGGGVAIPHLKSTPLKEPLVVLVKLDTPLDFGALDGEPVDLVCVVLSPQMDGVLHLRRLSRITRLFRESYILDRLRAASSEKEMADLFSHTHQTQQGLAA